MITIPVPSLDPVWIAALGVMLTLATLHLLFLPGYFRHNELPRPVTYVLGVLVIGMGFTLLYLFGRPAPIDPLRPIADFWILAAAGAVPSIAAMLQEQNGRHYVIRAMCGHIANHSAEILSLNERHLRGYDPAHDDNIGVMCDRIGLLLRDEGLVRALPAAHVAIMRSGVSAIRTALFARHGQHARHQDAARFEQPQRMERAA